MMLYKLSPANKLFINAYIVIVVITDTQGYVYKYIYMCVHLQLIIDNLYLKNYDCIFYFLTN